VGVPDEYKQRHETNIDRQYYLPVIDGMRAAVVHGTVNPMANLPGTDLCGKTGTAQNAKRGHKFDHSIFVGFAPMNNPKIAIAVFVENAGWGGDAAASVAALVAERYLKRKTEAKRLDRIVKAWNFLPPVGGVLPVKPKVFPRPKKDTIRKDSVIKPLMTATKPKPNEVPGVSGN
jgi:penicillin-binding protein 2